MDDPVEINTTTNTKTIVCCTCSIKFDVPIEFYNLRQSIHDNFWCPVGHTQYFKAPSIDPRDERIRCLEEQVKTLSAQIVDLEVKALDTKLREALTNRISELEDKLAAKAEK